jgi:hypothetical protein
MNIPDAILDKAYIIYDEFGPDRRIDRKERLKNEFGQLTSGEITVLIKHMKAVSQTVWSIAEKGGEIKLGRLKVIKLLQARHPFLKTNGLDRAVFMVNYYAWHEGYDK